jgi:hypothetical protein
MPANATRPSLLLELTSQFWVRQRRFKRKPRTCASRTISDILLRPRFALAVVAIAAQNLYLVPGAQGQNEDMPCDAFVKKPRWVMDRNTSGLCPKRQLQRSGRRRISPR